MPPFTQVAQGADRLVTVTLASDSSFDSRYLQDITRNVNSYTTTELGVRLAVQENTTFADLVPDGVSDEPNSMPSRLRQLVSSHTRHDPDILFLALRQNGAIGTRLSTYKGIADMVGGVGTRKNNLAIGFFSGSKDEDTRVMLHEIGHLLGAQHSMTGFMVPNTLLLEFATGYSKSSRAEIFAALTRRHVAFQSQAPTQAPSQAPTLISNSSTTAALISGS